MNVLITGSSGTLGRSVAKRLVRSGHNVRALLNGRAIDRRDLDQRVEHVWGNLARSQELEEVTSGMHAIVHCAWESRRFPSDNFERANVEGTIRLLETAARSGVCTFVHVSSVSVYGLRRARSSQAYDESSPMVSEADSVDTYPWAKVRIEQVIDRLRQCLDMNVVTIRPGLLVDGDIAPAKRIWRVGRSHIGVLVGRGRNHLPYIHVDDVADLVHRTLEKPDCRGAFNAVPTDRLPAKVFLKRWGLAHDLHVNVFCMPVWFFKTLALGAYLVKRLLRRKVFRPNLRYQAKTGTRNVLYDATMAKTLLGWEDRATQAIARTAG